MFNRMPRLQPFQSAVLGNETRVKTQNHRIQPLEIRHIWTPMFSSYQTIFQLLGTGIPWNLEPLVPTREDWFQSVPRIGNPRLQNL